MGATYYSCDTRALRATTMSYASAPVSKTFVQTNLGVVHESMDSKKVVFREARDSEAHPRSVPIILALDVTGSMGSVPRQLIADGLPTLMSKLIQAGCPDAALCFLAIGDHEYDRYPVQVAQFESGDAELDMWLTRTYLEGGGGGNAGESYPLAWEFAANRVRTDAWDKRKEKGFVITIGDEPFLKTFPVRAFREIYGEDNASVQDSVTAQELYEAACERFNVIHISLTHGRRGAHDMWSQLLGDNHIVVESHTMIPDTIADTIIQIMDNENTLVSESPTKPNKATKTEETPVEML